MAEMDVDTDWAPCDSYSRSLARSPVGLGVKDCEEGIFQRGGLLEPIQEQNPSLHKGYAWHTKGPQIYPYYI